MTLFAYRCPNCGHSFEQFTEYQSADAIACPACNHPKAKRQLARIAVRVANSGRSSASVSVDDGTTGSSCSTGTCPFI